MSYGQLFTLDSMLSLPCAALAPILFEGNFPFCQEQVENRPEVEKCHMATIIIIITCNEENCAFETPERYILYHSEFKDKKTKKLNITT